MIPAGKLPDARLHSSGYLMLSSVAICNKAGIIHPWLAAGHVCALEQEGLSCRRHSCQIRAQLLHFQPCICLYETVLADIGFRQQRKDSESSRSDPSARNCKCTYLLQTTRAYHYNAPLGSKNQRRCDEYNSVR